MVSAHLFFWNDSLLCCKWGIMETAFDRFGAVDLCLGRVFHEQGVSSKKAVLVVSFHLLFAGRTPGMGP